MTTAANGLAIDPTAIPTELTERDQWVAWRYEEQKGRTTKVLYNARSNRKAQSTNRGTWAPFGVALSASKTGYDGIGYVFAPDDEFFGIDLDACRDPETGKLTDWASEIVTAFATYTEVSPSGYGVKLIGRGVLPEGKGRCKKLKGVATFGDKAPEIATFDRARYWCMTGQRLDGTPATCEPCQEQLDALLVTLFSKAKPVSTKVDTPSPPSPASGDRFAKLLAECASAIEGTRSEKDFALCAYAIREDMDYHQVWTRVQSVGKFAESGERYFRTTWDKSQHAAEDNDQEGDDEKKPNQATVLVQLATAKAQFWHDADQVALATVAVAEHLEHRPLRSKDFKSWLRREYYHAIGKAPSSQPVQDAIGTLEGLAQYDGEQFGAPLRVAERNGVIYIDLCNPSWEAIEIDADGWRKGPDPPVRFRRAKAMLPLPTPVEGELAELRDFVNVANENWPLVVGWLVAALSPRGPYPLLSFMSEQGSGKSTAARALRSLIDPNSAPLRCEPSSPRDLMIQANNSWLIALDNLSKLPDWLSDVLCRLSTGGGFSTRELYENDSEVIFDAQRPAVATAIEDVINRADLLDRSLIVTLPTIPEHRRRPEAEYWDQFSQAAPRMFGGLLSALSVAIRRRPSITLAEAPRMADFAYWVTAAEPGLGLQHGTFLSAYAANRVDANAMALDASVIAKFLVDVTSDGAWQGTAAELLDELDRRAGHDAKHRPDEWPKTARGMAGQLKRLAPNLRRLGIAVEDWREPDRARRRIIQLRLEGDSTVRTVHTVRKPENPGDSSDDSGRLRTIVGRSSDDGTPAKNGTPDGSDDSDDRKGPQSESTGEAKKWTA